jgi:hypothetical protein
VNEPGDAETVELPDSGGPTVEPPTPDNPPRRWPRRRWHLVLGIAGGVVVLLLLVGLLGNQSFYRRTFTNLVDTTQAAEGAPVWAAFFVAQDCFIDAVVESGDPELAFNDGITLLDETDLLSRHVSLSLASFADIWIAPFHGALAEARQSIAAHYQVWAAHLSEASAVLSTLDNDPTTLASQFQAWVTVVVDDAADIESTFNVAGEEFAAAATSDEMVATLGSLFTPSLAACSRGAV